MEDLHAIFTEFKREFPGVHEASERLGHQVHDAGGPLPESTRWLLKVVISAASGHLRAVETHLWRAREAGVTEAEVKHALLLLIPTCGFPAFMEAYGVVRSLPPR